MGLIVANGWWFAGGGRKWEHLDVNENGKVERPKLHVKKGDFVQVELVGQKEQGWGGEVVDLKRDWTM